MSSAENAALLSHIVSQLESNVEFLVSQNYISRADANTFLAKLPNSNSNRATTSPRTRAPSLPSRPVATARALWAFNQDGSDPDDLSFAAGDIIEIVQETNGDWWMGRVNGREALFPSSYVEKIASPAPAPHTSASSRPARDLDTAPASTTTTTKTPYRPFGAAYHGHDAPPPAGTGVNSVGLQQAPGTEEKRSKFGKYGNTMAHSAAGGVGFGAGAAIGGGLVRAIF